MTQSERIAVKQLLEAAREAYAALQKMYASEEECPCLMCSLLREAIAKIDELLKDAKRDTQKLIEDVAEHCRSPMVDLGDGHKKHEPESQPVVAFDCEKFKADVAEKMRRRRDGPEFKEKPDASIQP